ncbi:hypothetical protein EVAR_83243_1 [Eumeta japonica]|uniref:Uncharacterized protein n=1 Tax=Eumeta variegata TaxID=151549 RepID=A0A4C1Y673_EUMVA|nr:hypothetical protein EVAR_83243_1 [Eumeta japonica]
MTRLLYPGLDSVNGLRSGPVRSAEGGVRGGRAVADPASQGPRSMAGRPAPAAHARAALSCRGSFSFAPSRLARQESKSKAEAVTEPKIGPASKPRAGSASGCSARPELLSGVRSKSKSSTTPGPESTGGRTLR